MTNKIVVFENVTKRYPGVVSPAVCEVNLEIETGEFFCLVGPSGCGKSTILKLVAGLEIASSGKIIKPEKIAMVFQSGALFPWLTVFENVAFGLVMNNLSTESVRKYLEMVGLVAFAKRYPRELSGGQRQRVGIARALVVLPEVLLLDEPFSALDQITTVDLHKDLIDIWQKTKITIVMVSHSLEEAAHLADRVAVMNSGKIVKIVETKANREEGLKELKKFL